MDQADTSKALIRASRWFRASWGLQALTVAIVAATAVFAAKAAPTQRNMMKVSLLGCVTGLSAMWSHKCYISGEIAHYEARRMLKDAEAETEAFRQ
jgi:hypothetical protein